MNIAIYQGQESSGGSKKSLYNLVKLLQNEHEFTIFCGKKGWFKEQIEKDNMEFICIPENNIFQFRKKIKNYYLRSIFSFIKAIVIDINIPFKIYFKLKELNVDIIILNESRDLFFIGIPALFIRKIKIISFVRGEIKFFDKVRFMFSDLIITLSNRLITKKMNIDLKKIVTIPNYINVKKYDFHSEYKNKQCKKNKEIDIAVVGSVIPIKGQVELIDIIKDSQKYSDKKLILNIIGDIPKGANQDYMVKLKKKIKENSMEHNIIFWGWQENVENILRDKIDILVLPSKTEGLPRVVMESMSYGIPCIGYNVGGVSELIRNNENGFLIDKGDKNQFSKMLTILINNNELRNDFSIKCIDHIKNHFSSEHILGKYREILSE